MLSTRCDSSGLRAWVCLPSRRPPERRAPGDGGQPCDRPLGRSVMGGDKWGGCRGLHEMGPERGPKRDPRGPEG
eukprot:7185227-Pyramimonas_sp.AAC.1